MTAQKRVMLLIDADNVSADVIEQALAMVLQEHGAVHVRRAYCTAESALVHQKLFKALSIRPIVNLSTGKNANDIALAIDAMDLAVSERPDVAVIVSSDSDFAPLVIRLREKGCFVHGYGQLGKTSEDSKPVYDRFDDMVHRKSNGASGKASAGAASGRAERPAARSRRAPTAVAASVPVPVEPPAKRVSPAKSRSRRSASAAPAEVPAMPAPPPRAAAPAAPPAPAPPPAPSPVPPEVLRILDHLPELRRGEKLELRIAAEKLRGADLLTRSGASTRFFRNYAEWFALTPERQPNKVRYVGPPPR